MRKKYPKKECCPEESSKKYSDASFVNTFKPKQKKINHHFTKIKVNGPFLQCLRVFNFMII